jgi:hypothetical protein
MPAYEYGKIAVLAERLEKACVDARFTAEILQGGEAIKKSSTSAQKADWMRAAMQRMDHLLPRETRQAVREACACCLGGKRLALVKAIDRAGGSLEERVRAANETRLTFGHSVTLEADGRVLVRFAPDETTNNRCVCLPGASEPISATYCMCCGGHIKHHLQVALGRKLKMQVRSSALSSGGKRPCSFLFTIMDN